MNQSDSGWGSTTIVILSSVLGALVLALLTADKTLDHIPLPLRLLLVVALVLGIVAGGHYYIVLGGSGDPSSPGKEKRYHALRMKLAKAGGPADVYATSLTAALGAVDVFFRDKGHNDKSWLARRLGLEGPGPRWTAKAFDRCLLIALIWPIAAIYICWILSGHADQAERALGIPPDDATDQLYLYLIRPIVAAIIAGVVYGVWRAKQANEVKFASAWLAGSVAVSLALGATADHLLHRGGALVVATIIVCTIASAIAFAVMFADTGGLAILCALSAAAAVACLILELLMLGVLGKSFVVVAFGETKLGETAFGGNPLTICLFILLAGLGFYLAIRFPLHIARTKEQILRQYKDTAYEKYGEGPYRSMYVPLIVLCCLIGAYILFGAFIPPSFFWRGVGGLLLFVGLFSLLNAPFDWISVGLTRALLRRAIERGGWWPFIFALVDAAVAVPMIVLFAFVTVIGVQIFEALVALNAGPEAHILDLGALFKAGPYAPSLWWFWALLSCAMIPSLLALAAGGAAFLRGIPWLNSWILKSMPENAGVDSYDRLPLAGALTGQFVFGVISGIVVQWLFVYAVVYALPALGVDLFKAVGLVAQYDVPSRMIEWINGL